MSKSSSIVVSAKGESVRIRLPDGVLKQLAQSAAKSGRSRNSEIVYRLVESLKADK